MYCGSGVGCDVKGNFSFPTGRFFKNVVIFRAHMSSSIHVSNKEKDNLILGEGPTQELNDALLTAKKNHWLW